MEFKKREVQKKFRPRQVKPRAPRPNAAAGGIGPDLGDMKSKIENEYQKAGEHPPEFFEKKPRKNTVKTLTISFKCEMFEMADFNKLDMLAPASSIDRTFTMEDGTRTYVYPIDSDNTGESVSSIVKYWKPKIEKRKSKFSISSKVVD